VLHIHRAERADGLVEALGCLVVDPLDDPMTPEVVSVPTRGIERWLSQQLSARLGATSGRADGVCANIAFPFPGRLVGAAVAAASGVDADHDPWLPERAVWPLLDVVDECLDEPWLVDLAAHLGGAAGGTSDPDPQRRARRFATVRHIADLYDRYAVHRPELLREWARAAGGDGGDPVRRGTGGARPPDGAHGGWQPELWRRLHRRIARPNPAERLEGACARLREDPRLSDLPARVSLFGLTHLPASHLQVLHALAFGRDVHLFLLHPSPVLWQAVAAILEGRPPVRRRASDPTVAAAANPLLASWGNDAREMQVVLAAGGGDVRDTHHRVPDPPLSLLGRIQADVREDRSPPGPPLAGRHEGRAVLERSDRSLQVHACHGRARQVEVVRDAILHLLAADTSLEARDVIVMCPDIEAFAPLVQATFGAGEWREDEGDDGVPEAARPPDLRVRLADRSLRQTNPVLGVVSELLELASARVTASQVLDLAGREPVRRRFGLDDEDLGRLEDWVADSGVRWGLDAPARAPYQLQALEANTWLAGLDRVLLGVAMDESGQKLFGGVLPLDDVDSGDIELAGRFAELIDRLHTCLCDFAQAKRVDGWTASIAAAADALTATSEPDRWQRAQLQRILDEVVAEATSGARVGRSLLSLPEVRALLAHRLRGRPTVANFRTGHMTVCTMVPMRSVPHRVVCLLGLDDGVYPRRTAPDGDDLIRDDEQVGDRDPRREDRQLLLDALLAATECLVVTYTARDERTNAARPPAVPLGELLDVVDATVTTGELDRAGSPVLASGRIVAHHPLQPFDPRNFTAGVLLPDRPWSFDTVGLDGARALLGGRLGPPSFLFGPLPDSAQNPVEIDGLVRFVQHPVRAFLRTRLGITATNSADEASDELPIELSPLEQWAVGDRLLAARLNGADRERSVAAERARGIVPPEALADPVLQPVAATVDALLQEAGALVPVGGDATSVDVNITLPGGRSVVGTVPGVVGDVLLAVIYSRLAPRHRLAAWVRLLALSASYPDRAYTAVTVGRGPRSSIAVARISAPGAHALARLDALVGLYDSGMREALPLYCVTSEAYAEAARSGGDPLAAGRKAWESSYAFEREDKDPEHVLVLGGVRPFDALLEPVASVDGGHHRGPGGETSRLGLLARQLWDALLACEEVVNR
jgi:exodeoxyribonuclease V gamma subunit